MRRSKYLLLSILLTVFYLASCDSDGNNNTTSPEPTPMPTPSPTPDPGLENQFGLINTFTGLFFDKPLDVQNAGDGTNRLFVAEQRGVIMVLNNLPGLQNGELIQRNVTSDMFLDIRDRILFDDSEQGLLGFTFHPNFTNNGYVYVHYTASNPSRSVVSRFEVSSNNADLVDTQTELVILEIPQPHPFHNGGQLVFGPQDGYLYISMGDGGPAGGLGTGQDLTDLLGTIIRIDVNNTQNGLNYSIPPDNPFANNNQGIREEIYAYGLRNPWRVAFNEMSGRLWSGDVGEASREELNIIVNGANYGWSITEGTQCIQQGCNPSDFELPVLEYGRSTGGSVIGGVFYYGNEFPELTGMYLYADFVSGRVWALQYDGFNVVQNVQLLNFNAFSIVAFGLDEQGEPYIASFDGNIYRLERLD